MWTGPGSGRGGFLSTTLDAVADRRRLPVIPSAPPAAPDDVTAEARPPWHWVGFGTVAIFAGWLPLAYAAQAAVARVLAARFGATATEAELSRSVGTMTIGERNSLMAILALPHVAALGLAAFGGGYLVGRFGARAGTREASTAGAMTALVALVLALGGGAAAGAAAAIASSFVLVVVAVGFAWWGGRSGLARRLRVASR